MAIPTSRFIYSVVGHQNASAALNQQPREGRVSRQQLKVGAAVGVGSLESIRQKQPF